MSTLDNQQQNKLTDSDTDENDSITCSSLHQQFSVKHQDENEITALDYDDEIMQGMTASYTEISFNTQSSEPDDSILEDNVNGYLHDLEPPSACCEGQVKEAEELEEESPKYNDEEVSERPSQLQLFDRDSASSDVSTRSKALGYLNQLNGTVTQEGDMVLFVAEDLENKIKLSSPVTKCDGRISFADHLPVVDPNILNDLEVEVGKIATSVDNLTENLAETLHGISALTVDCLETYRDVVCKTCDAVDLNIKSMYQLMAKCEELSKTMKPIYKLSQHIKDIKHFLDLLENASC